MKRIELLGIEDAKKWISGRQEEKSILLDVRQPEEYQAGHLPGALWMPLPELIDRVNEFDPAKPVLAYCRSGVRSRAAAAYLLSEGFESVSSMDGGLEAWNGHLASGSHDKGISLLQGRETTEELVLLALDLEEGSRRFYSVAAGLTSDEEAGKLFRNFASIEQRHQAHIREAYMLISGRPLSDGGGSTLEGVMEGAVTIDDTIEVFKQPGRTLIDNIEFFMQLEVNALDLYIRMLQKLENRDAEKIFATLIAEEKQHLTRLGNLLGQRLA